jgi:ATP-dependent Clp endopeptidase proteolytic subunit ClpP
MSKTWFTCKLKDGAAEIALFDEIGLWGISASDFHEDLKALGNVKDINLYIDSPGGEVMQGFNIYNMLTRHKAKIHVQIDGMAASIASVIAMAGDDIAMAENAMMMIHNPTGFVVGDSGDMRQIATVLDKMKNNIIRAYSKKTGKDDDEIAGLMDDETWMDAQEALDNGFADEISDAPVLTNRASDFNLSRFIHPPENAGTKRGSTAPHKPKEVDLTEPNPTTATAPAPAPAPAPTPTPAPAPVATAPTAPAETEEAMRTRITNEINTRRTQITNACALAGRPDLVDGFVNDAKMDLAGVIEALKNAKPANGGRGGQQQTQQVPELVNRNVPSQSGQSGTEQGGIDTAGIYARWNGAKRKTA